MVIFFAPQLFTYPRVGWVEWLLQSLADAKLARPQPDSRAEAYLVRAACAYAQALALRAALAAELTTSEAVKVLARFRDGQPLALCSWDTELCYYQTSQDYAIKAVQRGLLTEPQAKQYLVAAAVPWVRWAGGEQYEVWLPPQLRMLSAADPAAAFEQAQRWFCAWDATYTEPRSLSDFPPVAWFRQQERATSAAQPPNETVRCIAELGEESQCWHKE